ncbi:MAG: Ralstonia phage [Bacteroidota bacterium]|jgi:hypothetical protein
MAETTGIKDDKGKIRPSLILQDMAEAIFELIKLAEFGASKYEAKSWMAVENAETRYMEALQRHLMLELFKPGSCDEESKAPHLIAIAWNAMAVYCIRCMKI